MYLEKLKKIKNYRSLLVRSLSRTGTYPNNEYINSLLNNIDERLAIFEYAEYNGNTVDVDKLNSDLYTIYLDLTVLYELLYELSVTKYVELESYCNCYLNSLENKADTYISKADVATNNTNLGNTIYYIDSGYDITIKNQTAYINLGDITVKDLSKIAFITHGTGFEYKNVYLRMGDYSLSPYSVNGDVLSIPGELYSTIHEFKLNDSEEINSAFIIDSQAMAVDQNNRYTVYGAKDAVSVYNMNSSTIVNYNTGSDLQSSEDTKYSFYLKDATYISFDFSNSPISKNFNDTIINNPDDMMYLYINMPKDSVFMFKTDGITYATKEQTSVYDNKLYITSTTKAKDFVIFEDMPLGEQVLPSSIVLTGIDESKLDIEYIAIKERNDLNI